MVLHHDRIKLCEDRFIPMWLKRLRHKVLTTSNTPEPPVDPAPNPEPPDPEPQADDSEPDNQNMAPEVTVDAELDAIDEDFPDFQPPSYQHLPDHDYLGFHLPIAVDAPDKGREEMPKQARAPAKRKAREIQDRARATQHQEKPMAKDQEPERKSKRTPRLPTYLMAYSK